MSRLMGGLRQRATLVCGLLVFGIGLVAYAYTLTLPYHVDDFVQFRALAAHSLADIWLGTAGLGYYRPLPFSLWKVIYTVFGAYPIALMHGINVVVHALNGLLVFALLRLHQPRDAQSRWVALVAALLFLLFPFSYQAVPWVGALFHPAVTLATLGALVCAVLAVQSPSRPRRRLVQALALELTLIAPFMHETGVMVAPALTLFYLTATPARSVKETLRATRAYWLCGLLAGMTLLILRAHAVAPAAAPELESRWQNGVYFLQGLMYPVAPLATRLMALFPGLNDLGALLLVCMPTLLVLIYVYTRLGAARLTLFACGWYALMIAPAWALLSFSYVIDGPRLMYEAAVGAALLWTIPLALALRVLVQDGLRRMWTSPRRALGVVVAGGGVLWTALGSAGFLTERADMFMQTRAAAQGYLDNALAPREGQRIVIMVNFPGWFAPRTPTYVLGHEGVSFVPDYSSPMDLLWTLSGQERFVDSIVVTELQSHWRYNFRNYGREFTFAALQPYLRNAYQVLFTNNRNTDLATYNVGYLEAESQPPPTRYVAGYEGQLALLSGEWAKQGNVLQVTLHWQLTQPITQEVRTFVHLQAENGELIAQEDGLPLMGLSNPIFWKPGDQWRDMRVLRLPPNLKAGRYTLRVGVYPAFGGARWSAAGPEGLRWPDDAVVLGNLTLP